MNKTNKTMKSMETDSDEKKEERNKKNGLTHAWRGAHSPPRNILYVGRLCLSCTFPYDARRWMADLAHI